MLFSSIPFLYYFLPITMIAYFLAPRACKNAVLMLASLFFYGWGEPRYVVLMIVSIAVGYGGGLLIERFKGQKASLWITWATVGILLSFLGYFKYADFFIDNVNAVTGLSIPLLRIALPIGISFYTFQILSYNVDVYRGDVKAQRNPIDLAAYVTMFPQLIAGPIVRYSDIEIQLRERRHTFDKIAYGIRRFVLGLGKKILIANALGELCDIFRESDEKSILFYWVYAIAFSLHIYFDFSGYSDMAIGLGRIFGFRFLENFDHPYISSSVTEFWRRWHMSLGSWFRDYVYIPLGGNRVSKPRWFFNIFVVWMLTGFWHGAAWNFILWGLLFAILLVIEKLWLLRPLSKTRVISHVYVLFFVMISFVLFNAASLEQAYNDVISLFGFGGVPLVSSETLYYLQSYTPLFIIAVVGATPLPAKLTNRLLGTNVGSKISIVLEPLVLTGLLVLMTAFLVDGSFNPFLYFRF